MSEKKFEVEFDAYTKLSEFIDTLQKAQAEVGDIPVRVLYDGYDNRPIVLYEEWHENGVEKSGIFVYWS
jgi:hypothetical protein